MRTPLGVAQSTLIDFQHFDRLSDRWLAKADKILIGDSFANATHRVVNPAPAVLRNKTTPSADLYSSANLMSKLFRTVLKTFYL